MMKLHTTFKLLAVFCVITGVVYNYQYLFKKRGLFTFTILYDNEEQLPSSPENDAGNPSDGPSPDGGGPSVSSYNDNNDKLNVGIDEGPSPDGGGPSDPDDNGNDKDKKPLLNIVIIYPDDMRHDTISIAGTQLVQTPVLDQLASERGGIRFTHNCVTTSICWISRATLFTGQYLARHKSSKLGYTAFYNEWNTSWPYLLQKERGYYVGHIGKWQFRDSNGFVKSVFNYTDLFEGQHWYNVGGKKMHVTDRTTQSTIHFLRTRPKDGTPFAVTAAYYPPKGINGKNFHYWNPKPESEQLYTNVTIPEPYDMNGTFAKLPHEIFTEQNMGRETWAYGLGTTERYQHNMKDMYRMITEVDTGVGEIIRELQNQNLMNNTMVIFTSDNGMLHGEHGLSGKWFPFEESIRVPLIVWDPRISEAKRGIVDDSFTLNIDLAPTILGAAGNIDPPPGMQGRDFSDLYLNKDDDAKTTKPWRTEFYYEHPTHMGEHKIPKSSALVRKDFKYIRYDNFNVETLFHLQTDPMELHDVVSNPVYAKQVAEMRIRYEELKQVIAKPPPYDGTTV